MEKLYKHVAADKNKVSFHITKAFFVYTVQTLQ